MNAEENRAKANERAQKIIDAYFAGGLSEELNRKLLGWIVARFDSDHLDDALFEKWVATVRREERPDRETIREFDRAMIQLGFPEEVRRRLSDKGQRRSLRPPGESGKALRRRIALRIAAVLIPAFLIAGAASLWIDWASDTAGPGTEVIVSVTDGLQKQVTLSDRSQVWVNSGSTLEFDGDQKKRRVAKLDGEAFFKVNRDETKPFIVRTEHAEIRVLGTEFDVCAREEGMTRIALAHGSIRVKTDNGDRYTLEPGEVLLYDHATGATQINEIAPGEVAKWRTPVMKLTDRPLSELLRIVADYYGYDLAISAGLSDEKYSVTFRNDEPIESLLRPLAQSCGEFSYEISGNMLNINEK